MWVAGWEGGRAVGCGEGALQTQGPTLAFNPLIHNSQRPCKHGNLPLYSWTHKHTQTQHVYKCMFIT